MKKKYACFTAYFYRFCCLMFFCFFCIVVKSQSSLPDSTVLQQSVIFNRNLYEAELKNDVRLYNGYQYIYPAERTTNSPFWIQDSLVTGIIRFDGNDYPESKLKYDIVNQNIIINNPAYQVDIVIPSEKVSYFSLYQHSFFMLMDDSNHQGITKGFYDRLYNGTVTVWAKRSKRFELSVKVEDRLGIFKETAEWFIQTGNIFHPVDSKKSILKMIKNKEKLVNDFIKINKLNFKKDFELSLIRVIKFYDTN